MLKNPLHLTLRRAKSIDSMNVNVIDYACLKGKQNGITKDTYSRGSAGTRPAILSDLLQYQNKRYKTTNKSRNKPKNRGRLNIK